MKKLDPAPANHKKEKLFVSVLLVCSVILALLYQFVKHQYSNACFFSGTALIFYWILHNMAFVTSSMNSNYWRNFDVIHSKKAPVLLIAFMAMIPFLIT